MPNDEILIKMKVGDLADVGVDENTNTPTPAIEGGSVLFAIDAPQHKGKILFDLPDGSQRIVMSTDAEYAQYSGRADEALIAGSITGAKIDGVTFTGSRDIIHYTTCTTAGNTADKTASCTGLSLIIGTRIMVKYSNTNTADNPTLNVNSTGAKPIYYKGAVMPTPYIQANAVHEYVYDGTNWNYVGTLASELGITSGQITYYTANIANEVLTFTQHTSTVVNAITGADITYTSGNGVRY